MGVMMYDDKSKKVQCHLCGQWYCFLGGTHLRRHHNIAIGDYRAMFCLPISSGLCGKKFSAMKRRAAIAARLPSKGRRWLRAAWKKAGGKRGTVKMPSKLFGPVVNGRGRMAWKNRYGVCELQKLHRFRVVWNIVGRRPTIPDLQRYDQQLATKLACQKGGFNAWIKHNGFGTNPRGGAWRRIPRERLIAVLRKRHQETGKVPRIREYMEHHAGLPSDKPFLREFGSWRAALSAAGLV
jgi:hypothetical protein